MITSFTAPLPLLLLLSLSPLALNLIIFIPHLSKSPNLFLIPCFLETHPHNTHKIPKPIFRLSGHAMGLPYHFYLSSPSYGNSLFLCCPNPIVKFSLPRFTLSLSLSQGFDDVDDDYDNYKIKTN